VEALESRCVPSTTAYVTALYVGLLHRVPAASELTTWVAAINAGESPSDIAAAFTASPEYLGDTVRAAYQLYLNRLPTPTEAAGWIAGLQNGLPETQLQATFLASPEFIAQHGGAALPWLDGVYQKALGRPGSPSELQEWNQALQRGVSPQDVTLAIVTSTEADNRLVSAAYQTLLGRAPDPTGLAAWVGQLQHGMTPSQLLVAIASSPEFIDRQGGLDVIVVVKPVVKPIVIVRPVDTFFEPFLPPLVVSPLIGCSCTGVTFTGGFTGGFSGGFTGGFSGGFSGGSGF
jgi:hypothetical protein